jgi:hypothetical protein
LVLLHFVVGTGNRKTEAGTMSPQMVAESGEEVLSEPASLET